MDELTIHESTICVNDMPELSERGIQYFINFYQCDSSLAEKICTQTRQGIFDLETE